ncbi:MAG: hypothetical protein IT298_14380 [Chloroflexi bacterium]|jgi:hypothetical protein|nr:MAG: hypothetical protein UZ13_00156 [Chloroflexi bacterium OLB13]MBC6957736.1 hypothetical protein [Chloroflexota bacterium]MBV6437374.1 hypothetical protein [Anaerolineae bacterium]MDL1917220.1 hypothetical protein [Anaerolineae bacterium CFX4]OQY83988.1 MAG: hypothetical protein B6D42_06285 [Anaerolineae bacterium UTCFX5]
MTDYAYSASIDYVKAVQERYTDYLLHKPYVVGVSIGTLDADGDGTADVVYYCIVVLVSVKVAQDDLSPDERIPDELDGVAVKVQEVGMLTALSEDFSAGG